MSTNREILFTRAARTLEAALVCQQRMVDQALTVYVALYDVASMLESRSVGLSIAGIARLAKLSLSRTHTAVGDLRRLGLIWRDSSHNHNPIIWTLQPVPWREQSMKL